MNTSNVTKPTDPPKSKKKGRLPIFLKTFIITTLIGLLVINVVFLIYLYKNNTLIFATTNATPTPHTLIPLSVDSVPLSKIYIARPPLKDQPPSTTLTCQNNSITVTTNLPTTMVISTKNGLFLYNISYNTTSLVDDNWIQMIFLGSSELRIEDQCQRWSQDEFQGIWTKGG